jgi:hypothetical protein
MMMVVVLLFFPFSKNLFFKIWSGLIHLDIEMRPGESLNSGGNFLGGLSEPPTPKEKPPVSQEKGG